MPRRKRGVYGLTIKVNPDRQEWLVVTVSVTASSRESTPVLMRRLMRLISQKNHERLYTFLTSLSKRMPFMPFFELVLLCGVVDWPKIMCGHNSMDGAYIVADVCPDGNTMKSLLGILTHTAAR